MGNVLMQARRNELIETIHRGNAAVVDSSGRIHHYVGDPHGVTYMRSAAKPLQALAVVETETADAFGLDERELAVACASHAGQPEHLEAVRSILKKIGLNEALLQCGSHPPGHRPSREALYREGAEPTEVHSNCSGKHSTMLAVCSHMGWSIEDYREKDHPLQQMLLGIISQLCGIEVGDMVLGVDGCGVVVHGMPLANMALGYARLATAEHISEELAGAAEVIYQAMNAHPIMVSGQGRVTTAINDLCGERFVAKGGAAGVYCMACRESGLGVAVKAEDGSGQAASAAALEIGFQLGWFTESDREKLQEFHQIPIKNVPGDAVGAMKPAFELKSTRI